MYDGGKSDRPIVPEKPLNKAVDAFVAAEEAEGRGRVKENPDQQNESETLSLDVNSYNALERIRQIAGKEKETRFTALWHHICKPHLLSVAFHKLNPKAAPGVDKQTWESYRENLAANLTDLSARLKRGAYRAKPVQRAYVPKGEGKQRPIGIPALEDKIVQRLTVEVLNLIYESDFAGFSYGFRPKRNAHGALDALTVAIERRKVNWVLDADIRSFFDTLDHGCLVEFVERRIADRRVVRHIQKWLNAGVMENGKWSEVEEGTPQGGSISPLLANIYLHYVLDEWADHWRNQPGRGDVIIVRYADDFVVGFQHHRDAVAFLNELREQFRKFNLELHDDKTRLIEFGRFAAENRKKRGEGKPETFNFLGFTHICSTTRKGKFCVLRKTQRKRMHAKLQAIKAELRKRMHDPVRETGRWLKGVVQGYYQYFAVPRNLPSLQDFRDVIVGAWRRTLARRSQKRRMPWKRMQRLSQCYIPYPRVVHPYPDQRLKVPVKYIRDKSRVR